MNNELDEDRVKILAHDAINQRLTDFAQTICKPKYEQLEKDREERGKKIEKLDDSVLALGKCMNGKFNKLYALIFTVLGGIIITLLAVLLK